MLLNLIKFIFRSYFRVFHKLEVKGLENIPKEGGLIIACNHMSNFDPPLAGGFAGLRRDSIFFIKKELMGVPVLGWLFKRFSFIPVDRKRPGGDLAAMKAALKVIKSGQSLFIFPEGTRSKNGKPQRAKAGIGFMVYHSGVPVVPVRVKNTFKLPFVRYVGVTYGKPFMVTVDKNKEVKEQFQDFADEVMEKINKLD